MQKVPLQCHCGSFHAFAWSQSRKSSSLNWRQYELSVGGAVPSPALGDLRETEYTAAGADREVRRRPGGKRGLRPSTTEPLPGQVVVRIENSAILGAQCPGFPYAVAFVPNSGCSRDYTKPPSGGTLISSYNSVRLSGLYTQ